MSDLIEVKADDGTKFIIDPAKNYRVEATSMVGGELILNLVRDSDGQRVSVMATAEEAA